MKKNPYSLDNEGRFVVENYNEASPFAGFLPGIAGTDGVPLWAFYVNRGQGLVSFGVKNKDSAILEFFPADQSYVNASLRGFRTFLKIRRGRDVFFYEPFGPSSHSGMMTNEKTPERKPRSMVISPHEIVVEEHNPFLNLKISAAMFTLPRRPLAGLVRILTVENTEKKPVPLQFADGLPRILPYGLNQYCVKNMSRTLEAFMVTENLKENAPYLRLRVYPADSAKVIPVTEGNFFAGGYSAGKNWKNADAVVDPDVIFGKCADFISPENFILSKKLDLKKQIQANRTPAGFLTGEALIPAGGSVKIYSLFGHAPSVEFLNRFVKENLSSPEFFENGRRENAVLIDGISKKAFTATAHPIFDQYSRQTFLDNGLRGGFSTEVPGGAVVYLYGRKHGDLERDYNEFLLNDTHFSEGNGDFRDMLQNRRLELFFNPRLGDRNVRYFFNLIQPDGYNPLVLRNTRFLVRNPEDLKADPALAAIFPDVKNILAKEFKFAEMWSVVKSASAGKSPERLMEKILSAAEEVEDAEFEKGYWSDHWTYLVDLLENFNAVFPDRLQNLLWDDTFTFFDPTHFVLPRKEKYYLTEKGVRRFNSLAENEEKVRLIESRSMEKRRVRAENGRGEVLRTTLIVKILTLILNKLASLDPFGTGIEMEGDRPGWCDALNGLPGILGSSINETVELRRLADFLLRALSSEEGKNVSAPAEIVEFFSAVNAQFPSAGKTLVFWEETHGAKERFRENVFMGFQGKSAPLPMADVKSFLKKTVDFLDGSVRKARDGNSHRYVTYFSHEVAAYERIGEKDGLPLVRPTEFRQRPLPLFLEGFVHLMRVSPESDVKAIDADVRKTELFDKKLNLFRLNVPLGKDPFDLGRIGIFQYGWLENGSVFLHMHYKYVLELLRRGLTEEFYKGMKSRLVPFMDPQIYRRSVTENSSFIVSSGYSPDPRDHGKGFVSRLSGSTVEFLHMESLMFAGPSPFSLENGELVFRLTPALSKDFFLKKPVTAEPFPGSSERVEIPEKCAAFIFLGKTLVVYENPGMKNTFGPKAATVRSYILRDFEGREEKISGDTLAGPAARALREGRYKTLRAFLH